MIKKYSFCVLAAGVLWGLMGMFVHMLADIGIDSTGAVMLRCGVAALCFALTLAIKDRRLFRVRLKDLWCFFGAGVLALLFFTYCYFTSMNYIDLSTAAILLYTAPSIVMVISLFVFKEKFSRKKVAALVMAFMGCCLVSGIGGGSAIPVKGLLLGLGAGFGYALYSIFAKLALNRGYESLTVNFYATLFAAVGAALIWGVDKSFAAMTASPYNAFICVISGIITCFLPYLLYTYALNGMETGKASIMASVEPLVATLVGTVLYDEVLTICGALGILLILLAIVVLNIGAAARNNKI